MNREYHHWHSPNLDREMELLVFGHAGMRVLVFPTRAGRFFDYEDWGMVRAVGERIEAGQLQLYCVDSIDSESFYCFWNRPADRIVRHEQYEAYLLEEVLLFSARFNPDSPIATHGCSFGAYHAVNLALRHPHHFTKVVALSGRYDLTLSIGSFRDLFDGYYDDSVYFHTPSHSLPRLENPTLLESIRSLDITFVIGEEDVFCANNVEFSHILTAQQIPHQFYIWDGEVHRPRYWRKMVALYL